MSVPSRGTVFVKDGALAPGRSRGRSPLSRAEVSGQTLQSDVADVKDGALAPAVVGR